MTSELLAHGAWKSVSERVKRRDDCDDGGRGAGGRRRAGMSPIFHPPNERYNTGLL